jgi:hypothetical protein
MSALLSYAPVKRKSYRPTGQKNNPEALAGSGRVMIEKPVRLHFERKVVWVMWTLDGEPSAPPRARDIERDIQGQFTLA